MRRKGCGGATFRGWARCGTSAWVPWNDSTEPTWRCASDSEVCRSRTVVKMWLVSESRRGGRAGGEHGDEPVLLDVSRDWWVGEGTGTSCVVSPSGLRLATGMLADRRTLYLSTTPTARSVGGRRSLRHEGGDPGAGARLFALLRRPEPSPSETLLETRARLSARERTSQQRPTLEITANAELLVPAWVMHPLVNSVHLTEYEQTQRHRW